MTGKLIWRLSDNGSQSLYDDCGDASVETKCVVQDLKRTLRKSLTQFIGTALTDRASGAPFAIVTMHLTDEGEFYVTVEDKDCPEDKRDLVGAVYLLAFGWAEWYGQDIDQHLCEPPHCQNFL